MKYKPVAYSFRAQTIGETASGATSIQIDNVNAPYTPTLGVNQYSYAILCSDENYFAQDVEYETVKVTAIDTSNPYILTVERNAESTAGAQLWGEGTYVMFGVTAKIVEELIEFGIYGNWDGGKPDSNYGGMDAIDGGGVS